MKIRWAINAVDDLDQIIGYLSDKDPEHASRLAKTIKAGVTLLLHSPLKGRPGRVAETREKSILGSTYILIYGLNEQTLIIYRVLHYSRKYP